MKALTKIFLACAVSILALNGAVGQGGSAVGADCVIFDGRFWDRAAASDGRPNHRTAGDRARSA